jgi:acyl carrier protein phosphodiesterase
MSHEEADQLTCIQGTVPVMEYSGDYAALPLIENGMRKDLDPIFESNYIVKCINQNKDFEHWAKQFGRSHVWVRQRYELRKLVPEVKEFEGKGISLKQLLEVAKRPAAEQLKFAKAAKERFEKETKSQGEVTIQDLLWKSESTIYWPEEIQFAGSPSCKGCEFNSSTFTTLFNDGNGLAGTCYNKECFKTKDVLYKQSLKIQAKNILEYLQANGYPDAIFLDFTTVGKWDHLKIDGLENQFWALSFSPNSVLWALENHNPLHIESVSEIQLEEIITNLQEKPINMLVIVRDNMVLVDAYNPKVEVIKTPAPFKPDLTAEEINFEEVNEELIKGFLDVFKDHLQERTWYQSSTFTTISDFSKLALPTVKLLEEAYNEFYSEYAHRVITEVEVPAPAETQEAE